ncbi:MAG: cyclase family protein [Firmicutes bacterium]|nr:cyclase family protein [Bacillota bacterium]
MKIWDISMDVHPEMPVWKGREGKKPVFTITRDYVDGQGARETRVTMDMHTGTHIDAPLHFVYEGRTMDDISIEDLVRPVKVIDLTHVTDAIMPDDIDEKGIEKGDFVLLKTINSFQDILEKEFVYISHKAAQRLVEMGVNGVGLDALGVERDQPEHGTHMALLGAGVVIIEGLRLAHVPQGEYLMIAAPLKVVGVEAAPARVLLTELMK